MRYVPLITLLFLTACATHEQYQPYDKDKTEKDWHDCFQKGIAAYRAQHDQTAVFIGGALFGPFGALAADAMTGPPEGVKPVHANDVTDDCMCDKGYTIVKANP